MTRSRVLTGILSAAFVLTFVTSARADRANAQTDLFLEKLIFAEHHNLAVFDSQRAETGYLYAAHFENNNGKHLGFSIAAVNRAPRLGIVKPQTPSVTQNPEPTAMVLLGTGLTAVAAFARRKNRKRS
jgi:PEP-CTERM motif